MILGPVLVPEPALESVTVPAAISARVLPFPATAVPAAAPPLQPAVVPAVSRAALLTEFVLLFGVLPLILWLPICTALPRLALLWVGAAWALHKLIQDPGFDRSELWNAGAIRSQLPQILALFAAGVVVISVLVRVYAPGLYLSLPRLHPHIWIAVMIWYPILSVYPQGLVYRTWVLHRYRPLLQPDPTAEPKLLILASAAAFAGMHIIFHNWVAVALTFPGGVLFARHYLNSKSLCVSSIEHALYGCFLFTIGLGQFFALNVH